MTAIDIYLFLEWADNYEDEWLRAYYAEGMHWYETHCQSVGKDTAEIKDRVRANGDNPMRDMSDGQLPLFRSSTQAPPHKRRRRIKGSSAVVRSLP